jgi:hypothetical protein
MVPGQYLPEPGLIADLPDTFRPGQHDYDAPLFTVPSGTTTGDGGGLEKHWLTRRLIGVTLG